MELTVTRASLKLPSCLVRFFRQTHQHIHDPGVFVCRRVEEESILGKADDGGYCAALLSGRGSNDGDRPQILVKEESRFGHDQVGLELVCYVNAAGPVVGI